MNPETMIVLWITTLVTWGIAICLNLLLAKMELDDHGFDIKMVKAIRGFFTLAAAILTISYLVYRYGGLI